MDHDQQTGTGSVPRPQDSDVVAEVRFVEFLTRHARCKWFTLKVTLGSAVLGVILALVLPVRYTAICKITTPQPAPSAAILLSSQMARDTATSLSGLASGIGFGLKNPNDIYVGLLSSRTVADALIQQYSLQGVYRTANLTRTRKALATRTLITSEKSGLLSISVTDRSKTLAANLANSYPDQLRQLMKNMAGAEAEARRTFYEGQLKEAREELAKAEVAFRDVQTARGVIVPEAQSRAVIQGASTLRAEIAGKQMELEAARLSLTDNSPTIQVLKSELASLQSMADRMDKNGTFKSMGLQNLAGASLDYIEAQHEMQYRQALLDLLLKQYDAAKLDEAKDSAIVDVVEPAVVPELKSSPRRALIVVLFAILGAFACAIYIELTAFIGRHKAVEDALGEFKAAFLSLRGSPE
jgi:uncharacterized protein involved in exopolysaccharide biosynthesis